MSKTFIWQRNDMKAFYTSVIQKTWYPALTLSSPGFFKLLQPREGERSWRGFQTNLILAFCNSEVCFLSQCKPRRPSKLSQCHVQMSHTYTHALHDRISAVCTLHWRRSYPIHHRIQCPICHCKEFPLDLWTCCFLGNKNFSYTTYIKPMQSKLFNSRINPGSKNL